MMTLKWVDFFAKIDLCSKFGYIISKIGESPPKSSSSFPNRDPLFENFYFLEYMYWVNLGLKGVISIDADSGPPRYVLWCCSGICHQVLIFFQIVCGHTVDIQVESTKAEKWVTFVKKRKAVLFYIPKCILRSYNKLLQSLFKNIVSQGWF